MATFAIVLAVFLLSSECSASIQDHCSDISYWDEIRYETTTKQCCDTKLQQVCTTKSDQVCQDVLELQCEVVAWGECQSTPTSTRSTKCGVKYNDFAHQNCEEVTTSVTHTKKVPECKEVTKNNCVTDWDVDSNGNKVWTGTETCTPVTWEECEIVEKTFEFPTVKTECDVNSHIKWAELVDITTNIAGLESKCEVKKAVNCQQVVENKCAPVVWQECKMEPREECLAVVIHTPTQEKIHQKKCLTGDNTAKLNQIQPRNRASDPAALRIDAVATKNMRAIGELKETIETIDDDMEKIATGLDKRVANVNGLDVRVAIANGFDKRVPDYLAGYELILYDTMNDAIYYLKENCGANGICDGDQIEKFAKEIKYAFSKIVEATGTVSRWLRQHFSTLKLQIYDAIVEAEGLLKHELDAFLGSLPTVGGWSGWIEVGECSATCGAATKLIWRTCTNPAPANGGSQCLGASSALVNCALAECAIDGRWTQFSDWGACSKTCGGEVGEKVRTRKCTNPPPTNGGADCLGQKWEVQSCVEVESCPIDGRWTEFSDWSVCSKTCGVGEQARSRTCSNPPPSGGGLDCRGHSEEVQSCVDAAICPIDGRWTEFSDWGACSATCGEGRTVRTRTCANPPPRGGGEDCVGHSGEWQVCVEVDICLVDVPVNVIYPDKKLLVDSVIRSTKGEYSCGMQPNGNFAITNSDGVVIWSTGTEGVGLYFEFGVDGTLGIHDQFGNIYWTAGTFGKEAGRLVLENTGFLVLYSISGAVLWTSQHHKLLRGQTLKAGYSMVSTSGVYTLTMQVDGDFVLSSIHGSVTWAIGTSGLGAGAYLQFHSDGNLVLYDEDHVAQWDSGTTGSKAKGLVLHDDGQLVLCCKEDGGEVWIGVDNFIREGSYEYLDGKEISDSVYVEIKRSGGAGETYKWTNKPGETWTLYPTDEINVLQVGEDSPHYASKNHRTAVFNSAGVSGPAGSFLVFKGVCPVARLDVSTANAINNNLIGGVAVTLSQDEKVVEQLTTDNNAKGQFNSPHGQVVLTAELDGFTMAPVHLWVGAEECEKMITLSLSPEYAGSARVVMNWGPHPKDLDLHVKQIKDGKVVCHGFYGNKTCGGFTLDVDNRLGGDNGAETMTFSQLEVGSVYMVFVYDYTSENVPTYLPESQARVAFYRDGYAPTQMSVPTQGNDPSRRWWMVTCFNSGGHFVGSNRNQLMSSEPTQCSI